MPTKWSDALHITNASDAWTAKEALAAYKAEAASRPGLTIAKWLAEMDPCAGSGGAGDHLPDYDVCAADLVRSAVDFGGLMAAVKIAADEHQVAVRLADEMVANASLRLLSARFALEEARALI